MTLTQFEPKSIKLWTTEIKKVYLGSTKVRPPAYTWPELCFTANTAWSTIKIIKYWSPTSVTLETSPDGASWSTYTFWDTITLSNVWDKVYWRNTSTTDTWFNLGLGGNFYYFSMSWSIDWSWKLWYLLNKNWTNTLSSNFILSQIFANCEALRTSPEINFTNTTYYCFYEMFRSCSNLVTLPKLAPTTLQPYCYQNMFWKCSKIKLSTTQTGEYQTAYRIPTTWTGTDWWYSIANMFDATWWTFRWTPSLNTNYYTSNTVV